MLSTLENSLSSTVSPGIFEYGIVNGRYWRAETRVSVFVVLHADAPLGVEIRLTHRPRPLSSM